MRRATEGAELLIRAEQYHRKVALDDPGQEHFLNLGFLASFRLAGFRQPSVHNQQIIPERGVANQRSQLARVRIQTCPARHTERPC